jgi:hypothetical protein
MKTSNSFKVWLWIGLVCAGIVFIVLRYHDIFSKESVWIDRLVFLVWIGVLISPLFQEITLLGLGLKNRLDSVKNELESRLIQIQSEVRNVNIQAVNNYFTNPDPWSRKPSDFEGARARKDVETVAGLENVAKGKPVSYIPRQIITADRTMWASDYYYSRYSVDEGKYPSNLTDGDRGTVAYPASWFFDYVIDLKDTCDIKKVSLVWGSYGSNKDYITQWELLYQEGLSPESEWKTLASGGFPNAEETPLDFPEPKKVRRFRIRAQSLDTDRRVLINWIGMAEFEAYGECKKP